MEILLDLFNKTFDTSLPKRHAYHTGLRIGYFTIADGLGIRWKHFSDAFGLHHSSCYHYRKLIDQQQPVLHGEIFNGIMSAFDSIISCKDIYKKTISGIEFNEDNFNELIQQNERYRKQIEFLHGLLTI